MDARGDLVEPRPLVYARLEAFGVVGRVVDCKILLIQQSPDPRTPFPTN
jgi:hypothetical protein